MFCRLCGTRDPVCGRAAGVVVACGRLQEAAGGLNTAALVVTARSMAANVQISERDGVAQVFSAHDARALVLTGPGGIARKRDAVRRQRVWGN